jgi:hypothetical protein
MRLLIIHQVPEFCVGPVTLCVHGGWPRLENVNLLGGILQLGRFGR